MTLVYIDPFCGLAGDMLLGAWLDAGADETELRDRLAALQVPGLQLDFRREKRCGIAGVHAGVTVEETHAHRGLQAVTDIVRNADLPADVQDRACAVFDRLAEAEATVHGTDKQTIHFHEVGTHDAIVDIVGTCLCLHQFGWPTVLAGTVHIGTGTVRCAHGEFPVPAPATAALLRGVPVVCRGVESELVTPTGAALLVTLAESFAPLPAMTFEAVGYGMGTKDLKPWPNAVRVFRGTAGPPQAGPVVVLEANIDDMNPEHYEHVMERLFAAGALDVTLTPLQMKHNRPGTCLSVLLQPGHETRIADIVLRETTTLGVRWHTAQRLAKERNAITVTTPWGELQAKVARWQETVTVVPEYRACKDLAERTGVPLQQIYLAVQQHDET